MKKFTAVISFILCAILAVTLVACGGNSTPPDSNVPDTDRPIYDGTKTLVVYFSQPDNVDDSTVVIDGETLGNTQYMAYVIQENTGANIFRIISKTPYPIDHEELVDLASDEKAASARPAIAHTIEDFDEYDTVFIGYPIWWQIAAWPVNNFILDNDFTGKTVIPFATSASSGLGQSGTLLAEMAGEGNWLEGQRFSSGASQNTVESWLTGLGIIS